MKKNCLKEIINELESIEFYTLLLDQQLKKKKHQTDDLAYVLQKLQEVRIFLEPTE